MIKKVIEISREPAHLSVRLGQLLVERPRGDPPAAPSSIPCEDIGVVLVDHPQATYSHQALAALLDHGAALVVCGRNHLPTGVLLPMTDHSEIRHRIDDQINVGKPLQKRLWKQIVMAKIRAQAAALPEDSPAAARLRNMASSVKSGDTSNVEAQAAKIYWRAWADALKAFRRDPSGNDAVNAMLNYGYAVFRAAVARALVAAGLLPCLGIHHRHRANNFALADDLMEPLRPLVDGRVRQILQDSAEPQLDQKTKARLLELLTVTVQTGDVSGPLMPALHRLCASLAECYAGTAKKLTIPMPLPMDGPHGT